MPKGAFSAHGINKAKDERKSQPFAIPFQIRDWNLVIFLNKSRNFLADPFLLNCFFYRVISAGCDLVIDPRVINLVPREIKGKMRSIVRLETAIQPSVGEKSGCAR